MTPFEEEMLRYENFRLKEALEQSRIALDDWLNTYADELCDPNRVAEAVRRIYDNGGTLAYIATLQENNRKVLNNLK